MPTFNCNEDIFARKEWHVAGDAGDGVPPRVSVRTALFREEVVSPTQVLPVANTATIRNRWKKFGILHAGSPGDCVDSAGKHLQMSFKKSMMKDNLGVNECIVALAALEERKLHVAAARSQDGPTLLPTNCTSHSCVLGMKPVTVGVGSSSKLVKLAHLVESGKRHSGFVDALLDIAKKDFACHWHEPKPANFHELQHRDRNRMIITRDLTTADEDFALAAMNGSWDGETGLGRGVPSN